MITTTVATQGLIHATLDLVWPVIRGFNSLPNWHSFVVKSEIIEGAGDSSVGSVRRFTQSDGSLVVEKLLALDDLNYSMTYLLLDAPIPVKDYIATLELRGVPDINKTIINWRVDYKVPPEFALSLNEKLRQVFLTGFDDLNKMFRL